MARLSTRVTGMQQSAAILVSQRARELRAVGRNVIALGSGEPDFDTPDHIKSGAVEAIRAGETKYTTVDGIAALKEAVAGKFRRDNALAYKPSQISVSAGGKQVIANAFAATIEPGDEVLIPAPYWLSYPDMALLWGAAPAVAACPQSAGFKLQPEQLAEALTPRTRWLILNSPSNPTGAVYSEAELRALAEVLRRHPDVLVMSDDIYEHILFDGRRFATLAQVAPDLRDRILIVNGVSKAYCMTGWRIGFAAGPEDIVRAMAKVQGQTTTHPSSISQHAAIAALNGPQDGLAARRGAYQRRRDRVVEALNAAPGIDCLSPEGAFYVYPSCAGAIGRTTAEGRRLETDEDFALALLDEEDVAVVHGAAFGLSPHFRISIAEEDGKLDEACRRIRRFCEGLS